MSEQSWIPMGIDTLEFHGDTLLFGKRLKDMSDREQKAALGWAIGRILALEQERRLDAESMAATVRQLGHRGPAADPWEMKQGKVG